MSSYISPGRHDEGEALRQELAATQAVQPGPAHPRTPVPPPEPPRPARRAWWRWVVGAALLALLLLAEWWLRQGEPSPPSAAAVTGPAATIVEIRGTVDTTAQPDTAPAGWIRTVVTGTRLAGAGATFSIHSAVHANVAIRSGAVVLDQGGVTYRLTGGDCRMKLRSGNILTPPGTCE